MDHPTYPELGFYLLAGQPESTRDAIQEIQQGEQMGFGTAFISERYFRKEALSLCGAAGAVSKSMRIALAVTQHNVRHPFVTAGFLSTMNSLTGGRFVFGLSRGIPPLQKAMGYEPISTGELGRFVELMRDLLQGGSLYGSTDTQSRIPYVGLHPELNETVPFAIAAFAENSLRLGGQIFDEVILHTFFTDETTKRCVDTVRQAAMEAGRDPTSVKVWSCFATVGDHIPDPLRLKKTVGRLATYLQIYGDLLVKTNRWDMEILESFLSNSLIRNYKGPLDGSASTEVLENVAELIPDSWLEPSATGTPQQCVNAIQNQFALGCDGVILHGATPSELSPILSAYEEVRSA